MTEDLIRLRKNIKRKFLPIDWATAEGFYPTAEGTSYIAKADGVSAYFPTDDYYTRSWFYPRYANGALHEPAVVSYLLSAITEKSIFIDVGAHLGYFSIIAAAKAKHVFAIEALEFLIKRIHRNVCANHFDNVHIIFAAAGEKLGFVSMPKVGHPGTSIGHHSNIVPMIRLDDYFSNSYAPSVIKIDTEGYELNVLKGASEIIRNIRPVILLEIHQAMRNFGHTPLDLYDFLNDCGYRLRVAQHRTLDAPLRFLSRSETAELNNCMVFCEAT